MNRKMTLFARPGMCGRCGASGSSGCARIVGEQFRQEAGISSEPATAERRKLAPATGTIDLLGHLSLGKLRKQIQANAHSSIQRRRAHLRLNESIITVRRQICPLLPFAVRPNDREPIDLRRLVQSEDVAAIGGGSVTAAALGKVPLRLSLVLQDQFGPHYVGMVPPHEFDAQPMIVCRLVVQQHDRRIEMTDDQIDAPIVIEIAQRPRRARCGLRK